MIVSLLLTLNIILTFFSSVSNVVCEHVFFHLNITTIMVATIIIYVNTTMIMTMIETATMIMVVSKTMIMTVVATMTKNMNINMTKIFKKTIFIACSE